MKIWQLLFSSLVYQATGVIRQEGATRGWTSPIKLLIFMRKISKIVSTRVAAFDFSYQICLFVVDPWDLLVNILASEETHKINRVFGKKQDSLGGDKVAGRPVWENNFVCLAHKFLISSTARRIMHIAVSPNPSPKRMRALALNPCTSWNFANPETMVSRKLIYSTTRNVACIDKAYGKITRLTTAY